MTLLFKYQSLRQPLVTQKDGEIVNKKNDLIPRSLKVVVVTEKDEDIVSEMQLNIQPREMLCD